MAALPLPCTWLQVMQQAIQRSAPGVPAPKELLESPGVTAHDGPVRGVCTGALPLQPGCRPLQCATGMPPLLLTAACASAARPLCSRCHRLPPTPAVRMLRPPIVPYPTPPPPTQTAATAWLPPPAPTATCGCGTSRGAACVPRSGWGPRWRGWRTMPALGSWRRPARITSSACTTSRWVPGCSVPGLCGPGLPGPACACCAALHRPVLPCATLGCAARCLAALSSCACSILCAWLQCACVAWLLSACRPRGRPARPAAPALPSPAADDKYWHQSERQTTHSLAAPEDTTCYTLRGHCTARPPLLLPAALRHRRQGSPLHPTPALLSTVPALSREARHGVRPPSLLPAPRRLPAWCASSAGTAPPSPTCRCRRTAAGCCLPAWTAPCAAGTSLVSEAPWCLHRQLNLPLAGRPRGRGRPT